MPKYTFEQIKSELEYALDTRNKPNFLSLLDDLHDLPFTASIKIFEEEILAKAHEAKLFRSVDERIKISEEIRSERKKVDSAIRKKDVKKLSSLWRDYIDRAEKAIGEKHTYEVEYKKFREEFEVAKEQAELVGERLEDAQNKVNLYAVIDVYLENSIIEAELIDLVEKEGRIAAAKEEKLIKRRVEREEKARVKREDLAFRPPTRKELRREVREGVGLVYIPPKSPGICEYCKYRIEGGTRHYIDPETKKVYHKKCAIEAFPKRVWR